MSSFLTMVANGQLETPKRTVELMLGVGDIECYQMFIVMDELIGPIIGLMFLQRNHTVLDMQQGILYFTCFFMQLETTDHKYSIVMEPNLNPVDETIPPKDRAAIMIQSMLYAENAVRGIL